MQMQEFPHNFQEGCALKAAALLLCRLCCWVVARAMRKKCIMHKCILCQPIILPAALHTHHNCFTFSATFAFMIGFFYVYRGQHFWSFIIHIGGHHISTTCTFKVYMHKYIHYVPVNMYTGGLCRQYIISSRSEYVCAEMCSMWCVPRNRVAVIHLFVINYKRLIIVIVGLMCTERVTQGPPRRTWFYNNLYNVVSIMLSS